MFSKVALCEWPRSSWVVLYKTCAQHVMNMPHSFWLTLIHWSYNLMILFHRRYFELTGLKFNNCHHIIVGQHCFTEILPKGIALMWFGSNDLPQAKPIIFPFFFSFLFFAVNSDQLTPIVWEGFVCPDSRVVRWAIPVPYKPFETKSRYSTRRPIAVPHKHFKENSSRTSTIFLMGNSFTSQTCRRNKCQYYRKFSMRSKCHTSWTIH